MKPFTFLLALGCLVSSTNANDQVRDVQAALKKEGFYYGEITGAGDAETGAAIRRFQIRNGISVTGKLNAETLAAMGLSAKGGKPVENAPAPSSSTPKQLNPPAPSQKTPPPAAVPTEPAPPVKRIREAAQNVDPVTEAPGSVRRLKADGSSIVDPPSPIPPPVSTPMAMIFRGTPYADAPREVQQSTVRRAQSLMAARRNYGGPLDGVAGPATSEAIFLYQAENDLRRTGRLDLDTLAAMDLLPSRPPGGALLKPFYNPNRRRDSSVTSDFWAR